jgi:co-chaperonin GroES (HSP10)
MTHTGDPKADILNALGDLSSYKVMNNQVLAAVYIRPEKTAGGIYLTDKARDEDKFQGKVALIVKMGPEAYADDTGRWFNGVSIKEGDWIVFRPSDGWSLSVNDVLCRMLDDVSTKMLIPHPDKVY